MSLNLRLTVPAATIEATDTDTRTLRGVALPYGEVGHTSAGPLAIDAGAVRVPANLRAVKLFREHGRETPIGYATEATDAADALRMTFRVANTPDGDQALVEASEGLRDSLSVELSNVTVDAGHVTAADLVGVAQVAIPAFAGAVLTAALDDTAQSDVNDLAQQILDLTAPSQDSPPADPGGQAPPEPAAAAAPEPEEEETPMTATQTGTLNAVPATTRGGRAQLTAFAGTLANLMTGAADAAVVNAALSDVTTAPAMGVADAFIRPAWLGELWTPRRDNRFFVNVFGPTALTSMTWEGWAWETPPQVADYAGDKAAIPSNAVKIKPATGTAERLAGGWDVDRIYEDFNTGFIAALLEAAVFDYGQKSEGKLAADILAAATDAGPAADAAAAVQLVVSTLAGVGANTSVIAMASDVFASFLGLPVSEVPWWLTKQSVVNLGGDGSTDVAGTEVVVVPSLPAGTVLGADSNAVDFRETGPFRVQAINIPNGGIDAAVFGYQGNIIRDARGVAKSTVTVVP